MTGPRLPLLVGSSQLVPMQEMGPSQGGSEQRWIPAELNGSWRKKLY